MSVDDLRLTLPAHQLEVTKPMFEWVIAAPLIKRVDTYHDNRIPDSEVDYSAW